MDSTHSTEFTPIRPNPFIVGNPVRDQKMFFGRESEFELVRNRFKHSDHGGLLVFCGERRSGKTSILFQILAGRLGEEFIPVLIDMQAMAVESENDYLQRVATEIHQRLGAASSAPDFSARSSPARLFQDFVGELLQQHRNKKLILLIDEYELFEDKIEAGILTHSTLNTFASMMEQLRTCIVFTGSQHLEQRKKDYWRILGKSEYRRISFLQPKDARQLIQSPVEGRVEYADGVIDAILRLGAGQPFYTQAICQNLIDQLNEHSTNRAESSHLDSVIQQIVDNPFPQMIFLWSTLPKMQKLALSLLAQSLENSSGFATASQLMRVITSGEYPLEVDQAALSTALEELFVGELLIKDEAQDVGYAFRMDLWRLWIRRMHSVWQVIREESLATQVPRRRRWVPAVLVVAALIGATALGMKLRLGNDSRSTPTIASVPVTATLVPVTISAVPDAATIHLDGNAVGIGSYQGRITLGAHEVRLSSPGHADSLLVLNVAEEDSINSHVALRPLLGSLFVETEPSGAEIWIDGREVGRSPVTLGGLPVARDRQLVALLDGYERSERSVRLTANETTSLKVNLSRLTARLSAISTPSGADVIVDGQLRGKSPLLIDRIARGRHAVRFEMPGFLATDTSITIEDDAAELRSALQPEPPGILVVVGDLPARIFVDDRLVALNLQNSGDQALEPGVHEIEIVLANGETQSRSIQIRSGERLIYDFTAQTLRSSKPSPE